MSIPSLPPLHPSTNMLSVFKIVRLAKRRYFCHHKDPSSQTPYHKNWFQLSRVLWSSSDYLEDLKATCICFPFLQTSSDRKEIPSASFIYIFFIFPNSCLGCKTFFVTGGYCNFHAEDGDDSYAVRFLSTVWDVYFDVVPLNGRVNMGILWSMQFVMYFFFPLCISNKFSDFLGLDCLNVFPFVSFLRWIGQHHQQTRSLWGVLPLRFRGTYLLKDFFHYSSQ